MFGGGALCFALRRGRWAYFPHESIITQMGSASRAVREAVYSSSLDASFAHHGACIAIIPKSRSTSNELAEILKPSDRIEGSEEPRSKLVGEHLPPRFQDADRHLRLALMNMDGAVVLRGDGEWIAVGSIVQCPGVAGKGGRFAATLALSKLGFALKVSQDGAISGFTRDGFVYGVA